jgi:hypothetical protein
LHRSYPKVSCRILVTFVDYIPNSKSLAYTVPEIFLNYSENRQKAAKLLPSVAPILTKSFVSYPCHILNARSLRRFQVWAILPHSTRRPSTRPPFGLTRRYLLPRPPAPSAAVVNAIYVTTAKSPTPSSRADTTSSVPSARSGPATLTGPARCAACP